MKSYHAAPRYMSRTQTLKLINSIKKSTGIGSRLSSSFLGTCLPDRIFPQICGAAKTLQLVQDILQMVMCAGFDNADDEL